MRYFREQGHDIRYLKGDWTDAPQEGTNYNQYWNYLRGLGKDTFTDADKAAAARRTWTGNQARLYGFTDVVDVRELQDAFERKVVVIFGKPQEQAPSPPSAEPQKITPPPTPETGVSVGGGASIRVAKE
ncbi:MAG: hypothetical protein AAB553_00195 [Patescibacteria group bacterium]